MPALFDKKYEDLYNISSCHIYPPSFLHLIWICQITIIPDGERTIKNAKRWHTAPDNARAPECIQYTHQKNDIVHIISTPYASSHHIYTTHTHTMKLRYIPRRWGRRASSCAAKTNIYITMIVCVVMLCLVVVVVVGGK